MKNKAKSSIKIVGILIAFAIVTFYGYHRMGKEDMTSFLQWWSALFVLGIGFLPLSMLVFRRFRDKGWLFSKAIGLAISGWLMWYLASCKLLKFTLTNCYLVTAVCIGCNLLFFCVYYVKQKKSDKQEENEYLQFSFDHLISAAASELMFYAAFLFWTYLRCFKPEIMGNTEKFMDYGLMASIDNAVFMPAEDMWLAGKTINYYYLGQYLCVFVKRLSGVVLEDSYNLSLMMVAGFAFAMPYSLIRQVTSDFMERRNIDTPSSSELFKERKKTWYAPIIGVLAGLSVCFAGNMHYPVVAWVALKVPKVKELLSITRDFYWFPDATRYIGYTPDTNDKTIHEFPSYSFILGDLHAHVINIMFVLTVAAILYSILQLRRQRMDAYRYGTVDIEIEPKGRAGFWKEAFLPQVLLIGFFIGFFHMTNYWDYPIYFVIAGAVILFSNAVICKFRLHALKLTAVHAAVILSISTLVALPFQLSFKQISTGVSISFDHTPLYQLVILWGLPISTVIMFLVVMIKKLNCSEGTQGRRAKKKASKGLPVTVTSQFQEEHPWLSWLYRMIASLEISDLFILTIGLCACGLVLLPEIVYVRDIYSGSYKRANTMFKLTYQAFILFGMCMPYIIFRLIRFGERARQKVFAFIAFCLLVSTMFYFFNATKSWFGDYKNPEGYKGLDCVQFMEQKYPEDYAAVQWINENIEEPSVIVEGVGYSYTYYQRISATTGHATIMGWETHEWLWRSEAEFAKPEIIPERQADVETLYTSTDRAQVEDIIKKYDVDYIYVGVCERYNGLTNGEADQEGYGYNIADGRYYLEHEVNDELLRSLGEVVYQATDENGSPYDEQNEYRTYIVKVNK